MNKAFVNKIFVDICESSKATVDRVETNSFENEGIVSNIEDFMGLMVKVIDIYSKTNKVPDIDKLIITEDVPRELLIRLNNATSSTEVTSSTLRDIRLVTYEADESPAIISTRKPTDINGIKNIKWRYLDSYDDPDYTGFSIARFSREIEAVVEFKVWGTYYQDIRKRSRMLRDIIDSNAWYFKHNGLREIVWLGSKENNVLDGKNLAKCKSEKYLLRYTNLKFMREKNLEQIMLQLGISNDLN